MLLLRVLNKLNLLSYVNLTFSRKVNGGSFRIPLLGRTGLDLFYEKETWMPVLLRKLMLLAPHTTFVDVGVNLGQTLLALKSISRQTDYIGFEPNPVCIQYTATLIGKNDLGPVQVVPAALGDHDGVTILYKDMDKPEDSSATVVKNFRETDDRLQVIVPVISGKSLSFLHSKRIGIVKIDVEGGELEVIKSLQSILARDHPLIICEILPVYTPENTFRLERQQELLGILRALGYVIFRINDDGSFRKLDDIGVHGNLKDSNYLFVPDEKLQQLYPL